MKQTLKHANVIKKLVILVLLVIKGLKSQRSEINRVNGSALELHFAEMYCSNVSYSRI